MEKQKQIKIIGAGLAGTEAANFLANHGIIVDLYEMKPTKFSPAHSSKNFGELVCSNSLKSTELTNACGLLKEEIRLMDSIIMEASEESKIPGGTSLNVDREIFSNFITDKIKQNKNIIIHNEEITAFDSDSIYIICTGPLGSDGLVKQIQNIIGQSCMSFFDASAPIITGDSINYDIAYFKSRYDKGEATYLNCPMSKEQYYNFVHELVNAKTTELHDFDTNYFEGCMPVEVMAKRGEETLRFGMLKPKGLWRGIEDRSYAVVQLRKDSLIDNIYNLVGFQTNLTFPEQKRVFSLIPGLEHAEFVRYGLMHRNSYVCAPKVLNYDLSLKNNSNIYIGGQFSGVEGYVESAASGLYAAIQVYERIKNISIKFPNTTMLGSLINYLTKSNPLTFAPMNANFAIMYGVNKLNRLEKCEESLSKIKEFYNSLHE